MGRARASFDVIRVLHLLQGGDVARTKERLGKVQERRGSGVAAGRWRIDLFGHFEGRYLYSGFGQPLASRELAEAVLAFIEAQAARGRAVEDVVAEISPDAAAASQVEPLMRRWLAVFRERVETGRRQPRTLEDYSRWVEGDDEDGSAYLSHWFGKTLAEIDPAAIESWDLALHRRGLKPKTRKNILAALRAFCGWVHEQRPAYAIPNPFPWPELDDRSPTVLAPDVQAKVLEAIPWPKRGVFLAMAETLVRPSEARVLRVRDWSDNQLRVVQAAKDHRTVGVRRGLKSRNVKTLPVVSFDLFDVNTLHTWLVEHVEKSGRRLSDPNGALFRNPDGREGGWWSKSALAYQWSEACARAGVSGVSLYRGTKHSTMTALLRLGAHDRVLAALAGHRDLRSVSFYSRLDSNMIREAIVRLRRERETP